MARKKGCYKLGGRKLLGGNMNSLGVGGAVEFSGNTHEGGGIMLDAQTEVEDGETMDKVSGKDYFFSNHLKINGRTFSELHKQLLTQNAGQGEIEKLAQLQERKSGRAQSIIQAEYGGWRKKKFKKGGTPKKGEFGSGRDAYTNEEWSNLSSLDRNRALGISRGGGRPGNYTGIRVSGPKQYQTGGQYKKRQLKKAVRLTKKAEKQEKKAAEAKAFTKKQYGLEEGRLFAFQPSGKRSRRRAKRAADKAKAGSRKAYRKGKKAGIYKTGGFLEPPIETI